MINIKNTSIFLTLLSIAVSVFFDIRTETILAVVLVLTIGIIHGANDIKIIQKYRLSTTSFSQYLVGYIVTVISVGLIFFLIPAIALLIFVIISGYHFGEQHFHSLKIAHQPLRLGFYATYGLSVLMLLLYCNSIESLKVIEQISGWVLSKLVLLIILGCSSLMLLGSVLILRKNRSLVFWIKEVAVLCLLYAVFEVSSLVWGFAVYFVFWHAIPSLLDQVRFLNGAITKASILRYIKSSLLYWFMAILGLLVFIYFFKDRDGLLLSLFFTFLAAITFPHVLVMHGLFHKE